MLLTTPEARTHAEAQTASARRTSPVQLAAQYRQHDFTRHDDKHANLGTSWMFAALCAMLIVLAALGIYGQRAAHQQSADPSWVLYTHKLLSHITAMHAAMTDVEASQHGYILNGDQAFIDAFHDAVAQLGAQYHALRLLVQAQPEHQRSVDGLAPLLSARIAYAINEFETQLAQERSAPQALSVRSEERQLDENLRTALDQIKEAEEALVIVHQQSAEHNAQRAVMMSVFSFIGALGIAAIALCALFFEMRNKRIIRAPHSLRSAEQHAAAEQKQAARLHDSEQRLQAVISGSRVGVWDWDLDTNEVHFSKEWKDQLGYAENEIRDHFDEWQKRVHPDDVEPTLAIVHRFIKAPWTNYETEFRMRHKNGSWRWILARASLLSDGHGGPLHMVGVHLDITERKHVEEALCTSQAQLLSLVNDSASNARPGERKP